MKKESLVVYLYECFCELFEKIDNKYTCHFGEMDETEEYGICINFRGNVNDMPRDLSGKFIQNKIAMTLNIHGGLDTSIADTYSFIETFIDYFSNHHNFVYSDDDTNEVHVVIANIDLRGNMNYLGRTGSKSIPCWSVNYTVTYGK